MARSAGAPLGERARRAFRNWLPLLLLVSGPISFILILSYVAVPYNLRPSVVLELLYFCGVVGVAAYFLLFLEFERVRRGMGYGVAEGLMIPGLASAVASAAVFVFGYGSFLLFTWIPSDLSTPVNGLVVGFDLFGAPLASPLLMAVAIDARTQFSRARRGSRDRTTTTA